MVDSEDLPLNVSRESIQSNRVMAQMKKVVTGKVIDMLKTLGKDKPEEYENFGRPTAGSIKEGVASDPENYEALLPLLRFHTVNQPQKWVSLDDYILEIKPEQKKIFYILGDDERSVQHSPHLEAFRHHKQDVLILTDPLDSFMLLRLDKYKDFELANVANERPDAQEKAPEDAAKTG